MEPHINQMYAEWQRFREELGEDWTTLREMVREYRIHKEQQAALGEEPATPVADPAEPPSGGEGAPEPAASGASQEASSEPAANEPEASSEPTGDGPPPAPPEPQ